MLQNDSDSTAVETKEKPEPKQPESKPAQISKPKPANPVNPAKRPKMAPGRGTKPMMQRNQAEKMGKATTERIR